MDIFSDIEGLVMEAIEKHYSLLIAGDINLSLNRGDRGNIIDEFCIDFSFNIANGGTLEDISDTWTCRSSFGNLRRSITSYIPGYYDLSMFLPIAN